MVADKRFGGQARSARIGIWSTPSLRTISYVRLEAALVAIVAIVEELCAQRLCVDPQVADQYRL